MLEWVHAVFFMMTGQVSWSHRASVIFTQVNSGLDGFFSVHSYLLADDEELSFTLSSRSFPFMIVHVSFPGTLFLIKVLIIAAVCLHFVKPDRCLPACDCCRPVWVVFIALIASIGCSTLYISQGRTMNIQYPLCPLNIKLKNGNTFACFAQTKTSLDSVWKTSLIRLITAGSVLLHKKKNSLFPCRPSKWSLGRMWPSVQHQNHIQ